MKKKTPTQVLSCEYCRIFNRIFKITCCEEHLRTAASIRWFFDNIYLRQSGFCTTYSFKILISERKCKNNLKNCESKKKYSNIQILKQTTFMQCFATKSHGGPMFYQDFKNENICFLNLYYSVHATRIPDLSLEISRGFSVMPEQVYFFSLETKFINVFKMC